ncbi:hypothetical protein QNI16_24555 [Cytophagaceae bacterium YF14B1]|uniref:Uncharacterized protein n=1 Tax=Xanthocytophaga flava TaxID=3048013 RepID=A0AAE3UAT7_9BACT|nr:hypothetical protein [Xanthocytophaga flavus]MDJ1483693.1 hypothetical protein [Xanthocytophaga flavus]
MPKSLLIQSSQVRNGDRGKWNKFDQQKPYIQGIQTGDVATQEIDAVTLNTMISGVPTPWARARLFGFALKYTQEDPNIKTTGLIKFYNSLIAEWKGLIACMALFPNRIKIASPLPMDVQNINDLYSIPTSLGRMLFDDTDLWTEPDSLSRNDPNAKPAVQLIYYNGKLIGGTSPYSLAFPAASYTNLPDSGDIGWYRNGKFDDPLVYGNLGADDLKKLFLLVKTMAAKIPSFEQKINQNRQGKVALSLLGLREFTEKFAQDIKAKAPNIEESGTLDGELNFAAPYQELFAVKSGYYFLNGVFYLNDPGSGAVEIDPKSLLLDSETLSQFFLEDETQPLDNAAVYYLKARDLSRNEDLYFPLPLSRSAILLFQNNLADLLQGKKDFHQIYAELKPNEYRLKVRFRLYVGDKHMTPIEREYKIEPMDTGKHVILWPNFISEHWQQYYLYNEIPANDTSIKIVPFFKRWENPWKIITNDKKQFVYGEGMTTDEFKFINDNGLPEKRLEGDKLVYYPIGKSGDIHKYEIYRFNQPLAGLEIRKNIGGSDQVIGYLMAKNATETFKDLSGTHTPEYIRNRRATVGIDFGSNNSCLSYSTDGVVKPFTFKNRRVFLMGAETFNGDSKFASLHEMYFFQNESIMNGQLKTWVQQHNRLSVVPGKETIEISGGVPIFEPNIRVLAMEKSFMRTNAGELYYSLKWENDDAGMHRKEGFLKTLWLTMCAELYENQYAPSVMRWSYPGALSKKDQRLYNTMYGNIAQITPIRNVPTANLEQPLTEAEAVCNYALSKGGLAFYGDNMMIGADVGGSTCNVLLVAREKGQDGSYAPRLVKQSSLRMSAGKLAEVTLKSSQVREAIYYFATSGIANIKVMGIEEMRNKPEVSPYYLNTILDRLRGEDFDKFYKSLAQSGSPYVNKAEARAIFAIPTFICGTVLFYSGMLAKKTIQDRNLTGINTFEFFPFGKGGRMFDWLESFIGKQDTLSYYNNCFKAGFGEGSDTIRLVKRDEIRQDNKSEVSFGLSAERKVVVDENSRETADIVGEEGFVFNGQTLKASDSVTTQYLEKIEQFDQIPANFTNFEKFLDVFLNLAGPNDAGIIENTQMLKSKLPEIRRMLLNYVTYDPEYINARTSGQFDYKHSILVLIAMCFLDRILIPDLFKG